MSKKDKHICLVDNLGLFSMLKIFLLSKRVRFTEIMYCSITQPLRLFFWLASSKTVSMLKFSKFDYELGSIFDKDSEQNLYWKWNREISAVSIDIAEKFKVDKFLAERLHARYSREKIKLFLTQKIASDLAAQIRLVLIITNKQDKTKTQDLAVDMLLARTPWTSYIEEYGLKNSITVHSYISLNDFKKSIHIIFKFFIEFIINGSLYCIDKSDRMLDSKKSKIAVPYLNGLEFNKRNDIFWYANASVLPQEVMIYFKNPVRPLTSDIEDNLKKLGFKYLNLLASPSHVPFVKKLKRRINIQPAPFYATQLLSESLRFSKLFFNLLKRYNRLEWWQFSRLGLLISKAIGYESFFKSNNIKVHFSLLGLGDDMAAADMGINLAGGVDISVHWSNFPDIHIDHASPSSVYFCWGPYYKNIFDKMPFLSKYFIYCGYIYDSTFVMGKDRSIKHRRRLQNAGVNFVVTLFDSQYSQNGWFKRSVIKDTYLALLSAVYKDNNIGLIIKTIKKGKDSSFSQLRDLYITNTIRSLQQAGRCIVLDKGELPNEAAYASDIVIGIGVFNTGVFESALCGIPFMTIDSGNIRFHPYYKLGFNKIVFNDIKHLMSAIEEYRIKPNEFSLYRTNKYSDLLKQKDPFQDMRSSERIGLFIRCLLNKFNEGYGSMEALKKSVEKYSEFWSADKIVCNN